MVAPTSHGHPSRPPNEARHPLPLTARRRCCGLPGRWGLTGRHALSDRVIGAVGFLSFWDRFGTPPMLVVLASATGLSLAQTVQLLAVYTLLYAVGQPLWGLLSDRLGRMSVLRLALVGTAVGAVASTLTDTHAGLLAARGLTGLMVGALYPTMLTVIGDSREGVGRARSLSSLQIWSSTGMTLTTLLAGTLAALVDWRLVFGLPALGALGMLWALRGAPSGSGPHTRPVLREAVSPWALVVYVLAMLEGAVMFGALSYVVPAMQDAGAGVSLAGLLAASYGIGVIAGAQVVRRVVHRTTRTRMIVIGGTLVTLAFLAAWLVGSVPALTGTALLIGLANSVLHVSLQGWATEVAPGARATSVALFAGALFLGSSIATFLTAGLADQGRFPLIYALAVLVAVVLTAGAALTHARFSSARARPAPPPPASDR